MELALSVHQSLLHNGGPLKDAVSFTLEDVAMLYGIAKTHLSERETLSRGELNSYLKKFNQTRSLAGARAIGFCLVLFAYHILLDSTPDLFPTMPAFLAKYPEYEHFPKQEQMRMHYMCKVMIAALQILDGQNQKTSLLEIVARICDGEHAQFLTGGGKVGEEKRVIPVERFFLRESGIIPEKSKKGQGKRRHSEVSQISETSETSEHGHQMEGVNEGPLTAEPAPADTALLENSPLDIFLPDDFYVYNSSMPPAVSQLLASPLPLLGGSTSSQISEEIKQETS